MADVEVIELTAQQYERLRTHTAHRDLLAMRIGIAALQLFESVQATKQEIVRSCVAEQKDAESVLQELGFDPSDADYTRDDTLRAIIRRSRSKVE